VHRSEHHPTSELSIDHRSAGGSIAAHKAATIWPAPTELKPRTNAPGIATVNDCYHPHNTGAMRLTGADNVRRSTPNLFLLGVGKLASRR
jgi:hypothetical protein